MNKFQQAFGDLERKCVMNKWLEFDCAKKNLFGVVLN